MEQENKPKNEVNGSTRKPLGLSHCTSCGKQLEPDWLFCGYCRAELYQEGSHPQKTATRFAQSPETAAPAAKIARLRSNRKSILLAVFLIFGGILIGFAMLLRPNPVNAPAGATLMPAAAVIKDVATAAPVNPVENEILAPLPQEGMEQNATQRPATAQELAEAAQIFANGGEVYIYNIQPATVTLVDLTQIQFTFQYLLSPDAEEKINVLFVWKVNAAGLKEYVIPDRGSIEDWASPEGVLSFSMFSMFSNVNRQQRDIDPNSAVLQSVVGMTPLYGAMNENFVDDPTYLEIFFVAPEVKTDSYLLTDAAESISNSVKIIVTP